MGWGGSQNPLNSLCKLQGSLGSILPKKKKISEQTRKKGEKNPSFGALHNVLWGCWAGDSSPRAAQSL